jgi:hypothetical protein
MAQVRVSPTGFMDKDTDVAYVSQGNYLDANDIRHRDASGNNFNGIMSINGNSLSVTFPGYTTTGKSYRVFFDVSDIASGAVSANEGSLILTTAGGTVYKNENLNIATTTLTSYRNTLQGFLNTLSNSAYGSNFNYFNYTAVTATSAYFDLDAVAGSNDFRLDFLNITAELCTIKCIQEFNDQSGDFTAIGSVQLDNDLYVFLAGDDVDANGKSLVSEFGVVYPSGSGYLYRRLLRSKEFGFYLQRNIESTIEKIGGQINIYWTDGINSPRVLYLEQELKNTTDGLLFFTTDITSGKTGRYQFDQIDNQTTFFLENSIAYLENIRVVSNSGVLPPGNKRYTGRFVTSDFVKSDFLYPTNPVPIYQEPTTTPSLIHGDQPFEQTQKSVAMTLKNIPQGIYKYFEFVVIEYSGGGVIANTVKRITLEDGATELDLAHTGLGEDNITLSLEELLAISSKYKTAQNLKLFDNRMVMSNITEEVDLDLTSWSESFQHSIHETFITGCKVSSNPNNSEPGLAYGEYQVPENVVNSVGYMFNDTYRFGVQVQWKSTKKWSLPYWVDDIRINGDTTNVVGTRRKTLGGTVSSADPTTERLTLANHGFEEGQAVIFSSTSIGGTAINTIYYVVGIVGDTFQLSTAPAPAFTLVNITSNGTGVLNNKRVDTNLTNEDATLTKVYYVKFHNINLESTIAGKKIKDLIVSYRFVRAERIPEVLATGYFFYGQTVLHPTSYTTPDGMNSSTIPATAGRGIRDRLFFYSPDLYYGKNIPIAAGDKVKLLQPVEQTNSTLVSGYATGPGTGTALFQDYHGYFGNPITNNFQYADYTIDETSRLDLGEKVQLGGIYFATSAEISSTKTLNYRECQAILLSSTPTAPSISANNLGRVYGQVFKDLGGNLKYNSNKELSSYLSTGHYYILDVFSTGTMNNVSVFGGDVFNQKSYMLLRMSNWNTAPFGTLGSGFGFYSQNTSNLQLINVLEHDGTFDGPGNQFPQQLEKQFGGTHTAGSWGSGVLYWCTQWPEVSNQKSYEKHYDIGGDVFLEYGFNKANKYDGRLPARIVWSASKVLGSLKDDYRFFSPLNSADLDFTLGEITHHEVVDGNLYTWQENSYQRQYFRESSLVPGGGGTDILVGSGSIMGSPGTQLTSFGCSKKWSIIKGKNPTGKDVVYWYNDRFQKLLRFGADGVRVISDRGMLSYFINNGKFVTNEKYPLSGKGVNGVWNDKYYEAIFTFKYTEGATNKQFTIVFDEIKNGFVCFHSYYSNIYLKYDNTFFSINSLNKKQLYLHDSGSESTYYGSYVPPTITAVMNYDLNMIKNFEALLINSDKGPYDTIFNTKNHTSFLDETDYELREDQYYSPIKNDSTVTGFNNGDTSRLWGYWLKIKLSLETAGGKQKLRNFIVKFRPMPRLYNQ